VRGNANQDFLRGVGRILGMPHHAQREPVNVVLQLAQQVLERTLVAVAGPLDALLE
jgi:hypothetical protein